jgi:integral membrane sensor domain MASE1
VAHVLAFVVGAGMAATAVSATTGVVTLGLGGVAPWRDVPSIWLTWWLGDMTGVLIVGSVLIAWARGDGALRGRRRTVAGGLLVVGLVAPALVTFADTGPLARANLPIAFVCFPPLLWAAFRFGPREVSALGLVLGATATAGTLRGLGPFARANPNSSLLLLQAFMATVMVTVLLVAALVRERRQAEDASRRRQEQLRVALDAAGMGTWEWTVATDAVR